MRRVAAYCMTRNIYHKVRPSLNSLLKNSSVDHVYLIAEDEDVGFPLPEKVSVIDMLGQTFFWADGPNYNCRWTYMVMMRIALCHILKDEDRVLALDLDTIVDANIDELWETPIDDFYYAGVDEMSMAGNGAWSNGGVILWNLKKMRDGMADRIIHELNTVHYNFPEQECMNKLCHGHIYRLNSTYNACNFTAPTRHPKIHHFAAKRRWYEDQPLVQKYKEEWTDGD